MRERLSELLNWLAYTLLLLIIFIAVKLLFRLKIRGKENIPEETNDLVITATHESYWDPPLIGVTFGPRRKIHFIAREGLLKNPLFSLPVKAFSTTINRDNFGKTDLIKMLKVFRQKGLICIFPEGTTSENVPPKSGTVRLVEKTNRKFLPLKIEFDRSPLDFPYFFAPAELVIGKPISLEELMEDSAQVPPEGGGKKGPDYQELTFRLMKRVHEL